MTDVLIPYSFVPGTKAMANEVNANFIALAKGVEDCKSFATQSIDDFNVEMETRLDEAIGGKLEINFANSVNITNCILEIPQRIKLELNNGVLTLKAGSEVIVPNGVGVFDEIKITNDLMASYAFSTAGQTFLYYNNQENALFVEHPSYNIGSGNTGTSDGTYYYTDSNYVVRRSGGANSFTSSFPLAKITVTSDNIITSIDQVFNGFGYIGSTIWVDKGVKCLMPDGRNENGTLKNVEFTTDKVFTTNGAYTCPYMIDEDGISPAYFKNYAEQPTKPSFTNGNWFNTDENIMYHIGNGVTRKTNTVCAINVFAETDGGRVVSLNSKQPFRAVDYSEALIRPKGFTTSYNVSAGWVAPTNGLLYVEGYSDSKGNTAYITIDSLQFHYNGQSGSNANHHLIGVIVPIYKGQTITAMALNIATFYPYSY